MIVQVQKFICKKQVSKTLGGGALNVKFGIYMRQMTICKGGIK
jgi:hypothetical protein